MGASGIELNMTSIARLGSAYGIEPMAVAMQRGLISIENLPAI
jgi:hypothetical protein